MINAEQLRATDTKPRRSVKIILSVLEGSLMVYKRVEFTDEHVSIRVWVAYLPGMAKHELIRSATQVLQEAFERKAFKARVLEEEKPTQ
jgi:hypothetical protein